MRQNETLYPDDWFKIGAKELKRAETLFGLGDMEGAGFNIQQAVEKYLKGYLLRKGWRLRKIHSLEILLNEAIHYEPSFEEFRQGCSKITYYYFVERYPSTIASEPTEEDISDSLKAAKGVIEKILRLSGGKGQ